MRTSVRSATVGGAPASGSSSAGGFLCLRAAVVRELTVLSILAVKAYSCFIGAFFAVFVPQLCTTKVGGVEVATDCTFAQNVYEDIDRLNLITLLVNLAAAASLLAGFYYEWRRERWIIQHLDVDYSRGEDALVKDIAGNEALRLGLQQYNQRYYRAFVFIGVINAANVALSIYFMTFWYNGFRTVTTLWVLGPRTRVRCACARKHNRPLTVKPRSARATLTHHQTPHSLTNFLLLARYLMNSVLVSAQSEAEVKALSVDMVEPVAFNVVGAKYRGHVKLQPLHNRATAPVAAAAAAAAAAPAPAAGAGAAAGGAGAIAVDAADAYGAGVPSAAAAQAQAPPPDVAGWGWGLAPPPTRGRYGESEV